MCLLPQLRVKVRQLQMHLSRCGRQNMATRRNMFSLRSLILCYAIYVYYLTQSRSNGTVPMKSRYQILMHKNKKKLYILSRSLLLHWYRGSLDGTFARALDRFNEGIMSKPNKFLDSFLINETFWTPTFKTWYDLLMHTTRVILLEKRKIWLYYLAS